tara:strand:+ start:15611 stop:16354 length:744 start_codon:yes stop_codon:yes gene_type:complete
MEFTYFFKDIKKFRKTYNKKSHIDSIYLKKNNKLTDSKKIFTYFFSFFFVSYFLAFLFSLVIGHLSFLLFILYFTIYYSIKETITFNLLKKTYAFKFIRGRIFTNYLINKKINKFFHKNVNKEELELIKNITKIEYIIKEEKIKNYLKENKKRLFETQLSFYRRAIDNSSVNYFDIIKYIIKNSNNKQLSKMDRNTVENLIKPLTIDEQLQITDFIKEFKEKENKLEENLNFIDNKVKKQNIEEIKI